VVTRQISWPLKPLPRFLAPHDRVGGRARTAAHGARNRALHLDLGHGVLEVGVAPLHLGGLHLLLRLDLRQRDLLGRADSHDELHVRGQELPDRLVEPPVGDRCRLAVRLLEQVLLDRPARDPLREGRHAENPHFGIRRPGESRDAVLLDPRDVFRPHPLGADQQHVTSRKPQEVFGLGAELGTLDPMRPVASEDEQ